MSEIKLEKLLEVLNKRNFKATYFSSAQEAKEAALKLIEEGQSVGIGGSMTIKDMDIHNELINKGNDVYWHWLVEPSKGDETRVKAFNADVYLASTNALTMDGELVNIDGTGNRVSSMFFGPKKVILICGSNKIVENFEAAIDRIKSTACPANARRLKLDTPCAVTGKCIDCSSKQRMCNVTVKIDRPTHGREINIFIVGETLGY
ncbi:MAG: hypothetical protein K0R31_1053 [Clostridiales bacterium]|nr:hypothetical protein [Clostridiales bacterium]